MTFFVLFFFFNDTATTEIYTLSLHDALPISDGTERIFKVLMACAAGIAFIVVGRGIWRDLRKRRPSPPPESREDRGSGSEEHTSELQSRQYLVCRLLLEKKKK